MSKTKKNKEQFMTPKKSPLQNELVLAPASGLRYGGSSVGHKGPKTTIHTDGPGRTEWAINRGHTINSDAGKKVESAHDSMMGRERDRGRNVAPSQEEKHNSKMVEKQLSETESMGSNRAAHVESDAKLRVPNFRKGQQS
jgi:hypothetical protein